MGTWKCRAILGGNKDPLCRAANPPSLQILRIYRKGMIDNIKIYVTPFVVMSCDSICPNILVCSK